MFVVIYFLKSFSTSNSKFCLSCFIGVSSSESVQHWIDSLNENDWKESSEEQSVTPEVYIKNFENHQFLLVPGTVGMICI